MSNTPHGPDLRRAFRGFRSGETYPVSNRAAVGNPSAELKVRTFTAPQNAADFIVAGIGRRETTFLGEHGGEKFEIPLLDKDGHILPGTFEVLVLLAGDARLAFFEGMRRAFAIDDGKPDPMGGHWPDRWPRNGRWPEPK